jgi:hypothetical protein
MEHRLYNTGDQVWLDDNGVVRVHTHDGLFSSRGHMGIVKTSGLYQTTEHGDQVWFGTRYGRRVVTKFITNDGLVWSEEQPVGWRMTGVELAVHRVQTFFTKLILKVLS